jgi:hypothetical protein
MQREGYRYPSTSTKNRRARLPPSPNCSQPRTNAFKLERTIRQSRSYPRRFFTTDDPARQSRNPNNSTTDFTDFTDKKNPFPIREIREIRGKKSSRIFEKIFPTLFFLRSLRFLLFQICLVSVLNRRAQSEQRNTFVVHLSVSSVASCSSGTSLVAALAALGYPWVKSFQRGRRENIWGSSGASPSRSLAARIGRRSLNVEVWNCVRVASTARSSVSRKIASARFNQA